MTAPPPRYDVLLGCRRCRQPVELVLGCPEPRPPTQALAAADHWRVSEKCTAWPIFGLAVLADARRYAALRASLPPTAQEAP